MARLSFRPSFLREVWQVFRRRPLKETLFGKGVALTSDEAALVRRLSGPTTDVTLRDSRRGSFIKLDPVHRGRGSVYLLPNLLGRPDEESLLLFSPDTVITPGPDLFVYLTTSANPEQRLGRILDLGLLKGTRGGQSYRINRSFRSLKEYRTVTIWCKQFAVLFSFASLN